MQTYIFENVSKKVESRWKIIFPTQVLQKALLVNA